jgi:hypothetical protein
LYWIYGLFAVALITLNFWNKDLTNNSKEESFQTINQQFISKHLVDSMVVYPKSVEVYLNLDSLKLPAYKSLTEKLGKSIRGPQYTFTIGNVEQFRDDMAEAQKDFAMNEKIQITYAEDAKSGWLGLFPSVYFANCHHDWIVGINYA